MTEEMNARVRIVEDKVTLLDKQHAVFAIQLHNVESNTNAIRSDIKKLLWIVIGGVATALVAFIVRGGLAGV